MLSELKNVVIGAYSVGCSSVHSLLEIVEPESVSLDVAALEYSMRCLSFKVRPQHLSAVPWAIGFEWSARFRENREAENY
jgi:hypothetical protein